MLPDGYWWEGILSHHPSFANYNNHISKSTHFYSSKPLPHHHLQKRLFSKRKKKKKRVRPVYIIFYQSFQRKGKRKMSLSHSHRFSPFRLNLMWKASCMPLLITNNPEYSSMPFLQLYFLYCSNKINGGDPNNFSQVRNSVHLMQLKFA